VNFPAITLCVASQRVFIVSIYFVIDPIRKLLGTPSHSVPRSLNLSDRVMFFIFLVLDELVVSQADHSRAYSMSRIISSEPMVQLALTSAFKYQL
jgi:hypothetical protein